MKMSAGMLVVLSGLALANADATNPIAKVLEII
jgi:hypothetical protein